ncbi:hypothetical protein BDM02DRAFT_3259951 [Thelephora ganbajun]|uniref:Uncharacterized protein n=1 Tax=Thelephora ganbajun TaxID=370292 RepID=A0ACB6ZK22_THEGA|nr:hypothetical protein BDM02DRAFT_3259951 [Thelephora ganbajun]
MGANNGVKPNPWKTGREDRDGEMEVLLKSRRREPYKETRENVARGMIVMDADKYLRRMHGITSISPSPSSKKWVLYRSYANPSLALALPLSLQQDKGSNSPFRVLEGANRYKFYETLENNSLEDLYEEYRGRFGRPLSVLSPLVSSSLHLPPPGKLLGTILPTTGFNVKEHMDTTIMANVGFAAYVVWVQCLPLCFNQAWVGVFGYPILVALSASFVGCGFAGLLVVSLCTL